MRADAVTPPDHPCAAGLATDESGALLVPGAADEKGCLTALRRRLALITANAGADSVLATAVLAQDMAVALLNLRDEAVYEAVSRQLVSPSAAGVSLDLPEGKMDEVEEMYLAGLAQVRRQS